MTFPATRRFRFRLRSLLVGMTLLAVLVGFGQWRRQAFLQESESLRLLGVTVETGASWQDQLWPLIQREASLSYDQINADSYRVGDNIYTEQEALILWEEIADRLNALGVEEVRIDEGGVPGESYTGTLGLE